MAFLKGVLFVLIFAFVSHIQAQEAFRWKEGDRYFYMADGQGKLHLLDSLEEEILDEELSLTRKFKPEKSVIFNLYTRKNPTNPNIIVNGNQFSLMTSTFNKTNPVKIVVHGWNSDGKGELNTLLKKAFLDHADVNLFSIDWSKGANGLYTSARSNAVKVGEYLGDFIDWLIDQDVPLENFHLMGHSIGAHIVGHAGRVVKTGMIPYITGLDPAGPLYGADSNRIRYTDGDYVEIIHTSSLGLFEPLGDTDFYPNGGDGQPGCWIVSCSHSRSYMYLADSIDHTGFMGDECLTEKEIKKNKCSKVSKLHMGGTQPKEGSGLFLLKTNKKQPYYKD